MPDSEYRTKVRRRTRICVALIYTGIANFVVFSAVAVAIGGDARNGGIYKVHADDGGLKKIYCVQWGHKQLRPVPAWVWYYSWAHAISIWITVAVVLLAMLTLAKDRIIEYSEEGFISGSAFITIVATVVVVMTVIFTLIFAVDFAKDLATPLEALPLLPGSAG